MRKVVLRAIAVSLIISGPLVLSTTSFASRAPSTVCADGCPFTTIQGAVTAASSGSTITIGTGNYVENVIVNKSVTLVGSGDGTVIYPALADPICSDGPSDESSLCAGASNVILIQASNVTVENLRIEGANPHLTGGIIVDHANIDARNGIIEDFNAGIFNGTTVNNVTVDDIYLRGIYASSRGTGFNFTNNTVNNVQGDSSSIAIFNFGGSGVMADNYVSNANDAISANWSTGTKFFNNTITNSGSGIHTDNNGGSGGVADLIQGNTIRDCESGGYGIFAFAPYVSPTFNDNRVQGCAVGLAAFGSQAPGATPTFTDNQLGGKHAKTTDPTGMYGAFIVTDLLGYGSGNVNAVLTGNSVSDFTTGLFVSQTWTSPGNSLTGGQATATAHENSFADNQTGANGQIGTVVNAQNNWWGCRQGPNTGHGCSTAIGTVEYTPWLTRPPAGLFEDHKGGTEPSRPISVGL